MVDIGNNGSINHRHLKDRFVEHPSPTLVAPQSGTKIIIKMTMILTVLCCVYERSKVVQNKSSLSPKI